MTTAQIRWAAQKKGCQIELRKSLARSLWRSRSLKSCDLHPVFRRLSMPCKLRRWKLSCRRIRELRGDGNWHDYSYLRNLQKCMYLNQSYHQIFWTKYSATDAGSWSCRCFVQGMEFQEEEGKKGGQCSESSEVSLNLRIEKRRGCWAISSMWKPWAKGWLVGR